MIIEVDEYKKQLTGYDPKKSEDFHVESAKLADKDFKKAIKDPQYKRIVFMAGGTASGKTEYAHTYLTKRDQLVYDGTFKNFAGFEVKTRNINRYAKHTPKVKVVYIIPSHWEKALETFMERKRKMDVSVFFDTHIKSGLSVAQVLLDTPHRVEIYLSKFNTKRSSMTYDRVHIESRKRMAKALQGLADELIRESLKYGIELKI